MGGRGLVEGSVEFSVLVLGLVSIMEIVNCFLLSLLYCVFFRREEFFFYIYVFIKNRKIKDSRLLLVLRKRRVRFLGLFYLFILWFDFYRNSSL